MHSLPDIVRVMPPRDTACPVCRYSMLDAASAVCPECGEALEAWAAHRRLRPDAWFGGGLTLCGFSCAFGLLPFLIPLVDPLAFKDLHEWRGLAVGACWTLVSMGLGFGLFRLRTRWLRGVKARWDPSPEWVAAVAATVERAPVRCLLSRHGHDRGACERCGLPLDIRLRPVHPVRLADPRRPEMMLILGALIWSAMYAMMQLVVLVVAFIIDVDIVRSVPRTVLASQWSHWRAAVLLTATLLADAAIMAGC